MKTLAESTPRQRSFYVLGMRVDATSYNDATARIIDWATSEESRYVCVANVHMVMEAYDDPSFRGLVNSSDLVTPDGMPLVWVLRMLGARRQDRVYGPELTLRICEKASELGIPVGFYGAKDEVLRQLVDELRSRFPGLQVSYAYSPPFRPLTADEKERITKDINSSGVRILFVGLGCPRQERWMAEHKGKIRAVMLGVGAAFDFLAGRIPQAPSWMQNLGLEWFFRLLVEPRRLWRRYFWHNPRFIILMMMQLLGLRRFREG